MKLFASTLALISLFGIVKAFVLNHLPQSRTSAQVSFSTTSNALPVTGTAVEEQATVETDSRISTSSSTSSKITINEAASRFNGHISGNGANATPPSPGLDENAKFDCDESVEYWRSFQSSGFWSAHENVQEIVSIGTRFAQRGPKGLNYWLVRFVETEMFDRLMTHTMSLFVHGNYSNVVSRILTALLSLPFL